MIKKKYVTIKDASEYTSIATGTLYDWASQRIIPSIKIGRKVLFDLKDIDRAMEKLKRSESNDKVIDKIVGDVIGDNI